MAATVTDDRLAELDRKLDALTEEVSFLARQARLDQDRQRARDELVAELTPVAEQALEVASRGLDELAGDFELEDLVRLGARVLRDTRRLEALVAQLDSLAELADTVVPLGRDGLAVLTERLDDLDRRGYFTFVRGGAGVLDQVVTSFGEDDLRQLGDNIVLILQTVKEMTQPEVMGMLGRVAEVAREAEPERISMLALARRLRDPAVKRGLHRLLNMLESLGERESHGSAPGARLDGDTPPAPRSPSGGRGRSATD